MCQKLEKKVAEEKRIVCIYSKFRPAIVTKQFENRFLSEKLSLIFFFLPVGPNLPAGAKKISPVIFCCCVTGAVDIKVTEDYSTSSFILAFIRFSCKVGYPRKLLPDAGSQLVKGCESMKITFSDVRNKVQTGKGNLISRAEKLKALGVASKKQLSE